MKKYLIPVLVLAMLLCTGCGKTSQAPAETTAAPTEAAVPETTLPPETTEETIPVPETLIGLAKVDKTPAILAILSRGDVVDVVGEYDEVHYVIKTASGYGLVEKNLLRPEGEAPYEAWTGYAYYNTAFYDDLHMMGEANQTLQQNTKLEILEDLDYCYLVQLEDALGFVLKNSVAKWPISYSGGGSGGGGGGGADGGDISLTSAIAQTGEVSGQAAVLADGVEVVLGYFDREQEIPLVAEEGFAEEWEGYMTVYLDGLYAYVPQMLVQADGEEPYAPWEGYSRWDGVVYDNYMCRGEPAKSLYGNMKISIIGELDNCYIVDAEGLIGYMLKEKVSETRIPTGGGGGSGGGGGGEWTPPAL